MKQFIRKADVILFIVLIAVGLAASAVLSVHSGSSTDAKVVIKSGGRVYARYPLSEDAELEIPAPGSAGSSASSETDECTHYLNYNVVSIKDGRVSVSKASCKNQVCVRHGSISMPGETIVCLPNRLVVSIEGDEGGGYDSITS